MHYTTSYAYYELTLLCFVEKDDDGIKDNDEVAISKGLSLSRKRKQQCESQKQTENGEKNNIHTIY